MDKDDLIEELLKVIVKHDPHSLNDIRKLYNQLGSIDRVISALHIISSQGLDMDATIEGIYDFVDTGTKNSLSWQMFLSLNDRIRKFNFLPWYKRIFKKV